VPVVPAGVGGKDGAVELIAVMKSSGLAVASAADICLIERYANNSCCEPHLETNKLTLTGVRFYNSYAELLFL
jgi:hypothetical protein